MAGARTQVLQAVILCLIGLAVLRVSGDFREGEKLTLVDTRLTSEVLRESSDFSESTQVSEVTEVDAVTTIPVDDGQARKPKALDTEVKPSNSTSGSSVQILEPLEGHKSGGVFVTLSKCDDSEATHGFYNTPKWLRQPMSSKLEALKLEKYGRGFFRVWLHEGEQFRCDNPIEFSLTKNEVEEQLRELQKTKRSLHSINRLMKGFLMPDGYFKLSSGDANLYYPPRSYCISKINSDLVEGLVCPSDDELNPVPKIRKCTPKGFTMKYDPTKDPVKMDILEVEQGWSPILGLGSDSSLKSSVHVSDNEPTIAPIFWQQRLFSCNPVMYFSDPKAASAHRTARYKAMKMIEDGTVLTRAKAHASWRPAAEDLGTSVYCIDGYVFPGDTRNGSLSYLHRRDRQMILACIPTEAQLRKPAFGSILVLSSILLAVNVVIYGLVRPLENVHGWTSAVFVFCLFMYFVCLMIGNARGLQLGSARCASIGILQHYFQLSVFFWIAVMNFDIWHVLRRSRLDESLEEEGIRRFFVHCCVALMGPAVIVGLAICIQSAYDLNQDVVILPLYGYESCALNNDSQLYYFLIPAFCVFMVGIAFGMMAVHEHYKLKQEAERVRLSNTEMAQARWHAVYLKTIALTKIANENDKAADVQQ